MKGTSLCTHSCCHCVSCGERKIHLSFCQDWTAAPPAVTGCAPWWAAKLCPWLVRCHHRARRKCDQLCHHGLLCVTADASSSIKAG